MRGLGFDLLARRLDADRLPTGAEGKVVKNRDRYSDSRFAPREWLFTPVDDGRTTTK